VAAADRHSTGCALADIDGDGDLDLVLLSTTGPNSIFLNDGHAHFVEHRDLGLDPSGHGGTTVALADVDGDGWLDLYVANYKPYSPADRSPPGAHSFSQTVVRDLSGRYVVRPELARDYKLIVRPELGGTFLTMRGERDQFFHNVHGRFVAESLSAGRFRGADDKPLADPPESFALTARFADLNGDGAPDLYVANDFEDPDLLFLNDGHGNFRLADWTAQRQMSNSSMGVDVGDVNGDGLPDLFVSDMLANDSHRLRTELPASTDAAKKPGQMRDQPQQQRNTLLLNRGDGTFAEISSYAGVPASGWSWSTMLLDVDLDGWQDILVANGHLWDLMDGDTQERLQNRSTSVDWRRERWEYPKLALPNVAYRNRGDSTFEDVSKRWRFGTEPDISHAMAGADLDGDGDLDVVVNRLDAPALVLRNDAAAPRIAVRLVGDAPNTMAVGAKIIVRGGPAPVEEHEVAAGGLYLSHSDYLASFATGTAKRVSIEVDWRDGRRTVIDSAAPNRLYEITTATAVKPAPVDTARTAAPALFEDATAMLGGHAHVEDTFDDWGRQYLLPDALSELGPGVAWFDADGDGAEDLIVGTGKGGRVAVFRNEHGRLVAEPAAGAPPRPRRSSARIVPPPARSRSATTTAMGGSTCSSVRAPFRSTIPSRRRPGSFAMSAAASSCSTRRTARPSPASAWCRPRCSPTSTATATPISCWPAIGGRSCCCSTTATATSPPSRMRGGWERGPGAGSASPQETWTATGGSILSRRVGAATPQCRSTARGHWRSSTARSARAAKTRCCSRRRTIGSAASLPSPAFRVCGSRCLKSRPASTP